jgi:DNA-3-methyladenine glycosylase II
MRFSGRDREIRRYEGGRFWQVIRVNDILILVTFASSGTVEDPRVLVDLRSDKEISESDLKTVEETASFLFSLGLDLRPFYREMRGDRVLSVLVQRLRGLKISSTATVFEVLISAITEQQISTRAAYSIWRRMVQTFGDTLRLDDQVFFAFPTPEELNSASLQQLRDCGLSLRKAEYVKGISRMVVKGELDLEGLRKVEDTRGIISELCSVRGVGAWTAELTAFRGMQRLDTIPADDLGYRKHVSYYYYGGREITGKEVREIAENWGRWKGLAGLYLKTGRRLGLDV